MPTGYTADVQNGKIATLREFALQCARAFGANIMMRDEPTDAPIREYTVDSYHLEQMRKAQQRLAEVERMSVDACRVQADADYAEGMNELAAAIKRQEEYRQRYEAMLAQVESWTPPTDNHREFKRFMMEQLRTSIDNDCYDPRKHMTPRQMNGAAWKAKEIERATLNVEYHRNSHEADVRRTAERNAWNRALIESVTQ